MLIDHKKGVFHLGQSDLPTFVASPTPNENEFPKKACDREEINCFWHFWEKSKICHRGFCLVAGMHLDQKEKNWPKMERHARGAEEQSSRSCETRKASWALSRKLLPGGTWNLISVRLAPDAFLMKKREKRRGHFTGFYLRISSIEITRAKILSEKIRSKTHSNWSPAFNSSF